MRYVPRNFPGHIFICMSNKDIADTVYEVGIKIDDMLEGRKLELRLTEAVTDGALRVVNRLEPEMKLMRDELVKAAAAGATTPVAAEMTYQYLQRLLSTARNEHSAAEKISALKMGEVAGLVAAVGLIKKTHDELSSQSTTLPTPVATVSATAPKDASVVSNDDLNIQKKLDVVANIGNKNKKVEISRTMRDARKSGKNKSLRQLLKEQGAEEAKPLDTEPGVVPPGR